MNTPECTRELEVLEAVTTGRWPDGCDEELRAHAADCPQCAEQLLVASAMMGEMHTATREADVPPSGAMWWRMQRRRRAEVARTAARAITVVQIASVAAAVAVAVTLLGGVSAIRETVQTWMLNVDVRTVLQPLEPVMLFAVIATLLLAPIAVYFVVAKD